MLGQRMAKRRRDMKLSQKSLAERLDCNESYISRIENGTATPTFDLVYLIARELKVGVDYFLPFTNEGTNILKIELNSKLGNCSPEILIFISNILDDAHQLEMQLKAKQTKEDV